jgi:hypothetical protein
MTARDVLFLVVLGGVCAMWFFRPLVLLDDEILLVPPTMNIAIRWASSSSSKQPVLLLVEVPPPPPPPVNPILLPSSPIKAALRVPSEEWKKKEKNDTMIPVPQKKWAHGCNGSLPRINFPLSVTTRNLRVKKQKITTHHQLPLIQHFLTSVIPSMEPAKFDYSIYVAADHDDEWLTNATHIHSIELWWEKRYRHRWGKDACVPPLEFFAYDNTRSRNVWAVNYVSQVAYERGYDCFYRANDDTIFMEDQWSSKFFAEMATFRPIPFLGVVGPTDLQHVGLLTHSFVCRPHFLAMGVHFNYYFGNWWSDPWIHELYEGPYPETWGGEKVRMFRRFTDVKVKHMLVKNRYDIQGDEATYLKILDIDRNGTLNNYIVKYLNKTSIK